MFKLLLPQSGTLLLPSLTQPLLSMEVLLDTTMVLELLMDKSSFSALNTPRELEITPPIALLLISLAKETAPLDTTAGFLTPQPMLDVIKSTATRTSMDLLVPPALALDKLVTMVTMEMVFVLVTPTTMELTVLKPKLVLETVFQPMESTETELASVTMDTTELTALWDQLSALPTPPSTVLMDHALVSQDTMDLTALPNVLVPDLHVTTETPELEFVPVLLEHLDLTALDLALAEVGFVPMDSTVMDLALAHLDTMELPALESAAAHQSFIPQLKSRSSDVTMDLPEPELVFDFTAAQLLLKPSLV